MTISIFNSAGRLVSGLLSDKIGALKTLAIALGLQTINMLLFSQFVSSPTLMVGAALAGVGYGTLLAVFIYHGGLIRPEELRQLLACFTPLGALAALSALSLLRYRWIGMAITQSPI